MKKIFIPISMLLLSTIVFGQAQETLTPQLIKEIHSVGVFLPYSPNIVSKALHDLQ